MNTRMWARWSKGSRSHDVPLGIAREDAVRPDRRPGSAGGHVHAGRCGVVADSAAGEGGVGPLTHEHPSTGVAPQLAALEPPLGPRNGDHGSKAAPVVDPAAA